MADPSVTVDVLVDTNTMKITNYGDFTPVDDGYATAKFDKPGKELTLPTVEGINGYTFTGWDNEVGTATSLTTEKALKLCADGKTTAVLNAQAKAPEATNDKKDNSTSSSSSSSNSSSSSSSNKTTTASNEKQVVKAAAAPANTTKVLPKTGATNAAPLIGGSLAVVALLMGYGVYGLVLRKKD